MGLDCVLSILAIFDESFQDLSDLVDLLLLIIMSCSLAQQESMLDVVTQKPTIFGGKFKPDTTPQAGNGVSYGAAPGAYQQTNSGLEKQNLLRSSNQVGTA